MATLEQRLTKLEVKSFKPSDIVIEILIGKGEEPTPEQQAQMDEVDKQGGLVIIRRIV